MNDERRPEAAPDDRQQNQHKGAKVQRTKVTTPLQLSASEFTLDELLDMQFSDHSLPFLTRDDVVFEGASHLLAAREKVGKSTLARHLCYAWATEGRKILYLSEEWRRSWRKQADELAFDKGAGYFRIYESLGKTPAELLSRAARGPEDVVVLDTATWLLGVSLGSRDAVIEGLTPWLGLCQSGKTLILLSHMTKSGDQIGGSYALAAGVDTLIGYRPVENQDDLRTVEVRSRLLAESPISFAVRKVGSTFAIEDLPAELTLTTPQAEVLLVLSVDVAEAKTWEQVAAATGFKEGKTRKALRDLTELGLARDITGNMGSGGRGNAARYVAIEEEPES